MPRVGSYYCGYPFPTSTTDAETFQQENVQKFAISCF